MNRRNFLQSIAALGVVGPIASKAAIGITPEAQAHDLKAETDLYTGDFVRVKDGCVYRLADKRGDGGVFAVAHGYCPRGRAPRLILYGPADFTSLFSLTRRQA